MDVLGSLVRAGRAMRADGWVNPLTGFGTRGKLAMMRFRRGHELTDQQLEEIFGESDFAYRIVAALPEAAMRQGFELQSDPDGALLRRCQDLGVGSKVTEAWMWGRLFGGGAILLGFA